MRSATDLLDELQALDETDRIEAKRGAAVDRAVMETVCAFANEPDLGGGYLLLGVERSDDPDQPYRVCGVADPDQLQSDLASQCRSVFNRALRPKLAVQTVDGHRVVVVFVPEADPSEKPVYLTRLGLPRGAFRRIGPTDQEGTDDDLAWLYRERSADGYEARVLTSAELEDLDDEAIARYRRLRARANPDAEELAWSDHDLLRALGAIDRDGAGWRPTVAGILLFGSPITLRRLFPMVRIDYIRIAGRRWVEDPHRRFDAVTIRAALPTAVQRAISAIMDDLPKRFTLPSGSVTRVDEALLPPRVIREAVVNAVMHRSYRIHEPIQILRYENRVEIRNPGHSLKPAAELGQPGSRLRNPRVAGALYDLRFAETKGSGLRIMGDLMTEHGLVPPALESRRGAGQFVVTLLFHHFLPPEDLTWLGALTQAATLDADDARALLFLREVGAIDNAAWRTINRTGAVQARAGLTRLRGLGLISQHGRGRGTYYRPAGNAQRSVEDVLQATERPQLASQGPQLASQGPQLHADLPQLAADLPQLGADLPQLAADLPQLAADLPQLDTLPPALRERLPPPGGRPRQQALRRLVLDLCGWRPLTARALGWLLGDRDPKNLRRDHLTPMVRAGQLQMQYPDMPNHPSQRYRVPQERP